MPCNIFDYLAKKDKPLADAIDQGCAKSKFQVRGLAGLTFLWPQDKDVRAQLVKDLPSADEEKSMAAMELLQRHILVDAFPTAAAFAAHAADIPNRNKKALNVSVDGTKVEFEGEGSKKAAATLVTDFKVPRRHDLAIWKLTGKLAEGTRPAKAYFRKERMVVSKVKGAAESDDRRALSAALERAWVGWCARRSSAPSPYVCAVDALLGCLKDTNSSLYEKLAPVVDRDAMATWYILVEPYRGGDFILPADVLNKVFYDWGGIRSGMGSASPGSEISAAIGKGASLMHGNAKAAVDRVRENIRSDNDDKTAPRAVKDAYDALANSKRIDGHEYFPAGTIDLVGRRKLCQDEIRYMLANAVSDIGGSYDQVASEFAAVVSKLQTSYTGDGGTIVDSSQMRRLVPNGEIATIMDFVKSPAFLYFAQ